MRHAGLEGLLHRSIARDDAGKLLVTTGRDKMSFVAEDTPYFIRTLVDGRLLLSDGTVDDALAFTIDDAGRIRAAVKRGTFWALALRGAAQGLAALVDGDGCIRLPRSVLPLTPVSSIGGARDWSEVPAFAINEA